MQIYYALEFIVIIAHNSLFLVDCLTFTYLVYLWNTFLCVK